MTFDLIFIGGRGSLMDCPSAKFGDFSFSRFGFIVRTDRQTDRQTDRISHRQNHCMMDQRYTRATTIGPK